MKVPCRLFSGSFPGQFLELLLYKSKCPAAFFLALLYFLHTGEQILSALLCHPVVFGEIF